MNHNLGESGVVIPLEEWHPMIEACVPPMPSAPPVSKQMVIQKGSSSRRIQLEPSTNRRWYIAIPYSLMLLRCPNSRFPGSKLASHPCYQIRQLASKRPRGQTPFWINRACKTETFPHEVKDKIASRRMSSWLRLSKNEATTSPLYLRPGGESIPYCRSCGRVISMSLFARTQDKFQLY